MPILLEQIRDSKRPAFADWHQQWSFALTSFEALPAIRSSVGDISFRELDDRSLELVHSLKRTLFLDDLSQIRVAIPVDRFDFLIAFLAVWKLNGLVIPFSPNALKSNPLLNEALQPFVDVKLDSNYDVCSYSLSMPLYDSPSHCSEGHAIFFTSGSTGLPRAVLRGWAQALFEANQYAKVLNLCPGISTDMLVAPYFGASTKHLLGCLLNGCSLSFPRLLYGDPSRNGSVLYATPSLLNEPYLLKTTSLYDWVSLTGEPVREATKCLLSKFLTSEGRCLNALGGTEFGVITNRILEIHKGVEYTSTPVDEKVIFTIDDHGSRCPPNVSGRLAVRSKFLADGYLDVNKGEIALTHFTRIEPGNSEFLTGDVAIMNSCGEIKILGRASHTLKRHGVWVDSTPLEELINRYPSILEYRIDIDVDTERLRLWLNVADLPLDAFHSLFYDLEASLASSPCLPKVIIGLNDFPRNLNGKIDLQTLYQSEGSGWIYELSHDLDKLATQLVFRLDNDDQYVSENSTLADLGINSLEITSLSLLIDKLMGRSIMIEILWLDVPIHALRSLIRESKGLHQAVFPLGQLNSHDCLLWFGPSGGHKVAKRVGHRVKMFYFDTEADSMYGGYYNCPTVYQCVKNVLRDIKLQDYETIFIGGFSFGALMAHQAAAFLSQKKIPISGVLLLDPPRVEVSVYKAFSRRLRLGVRECLESIFGESYVDPLFKQSRKRLVRKVAIGKFQPLENSQKTWIVTNLKDHPSTERKFSKISNVVEWIELPTKDHHAVMGPEFQERWLLILDQWIDKRTNS